VHAGGAAYTDSLGHTWSADTGFSGGNLYGGPGAVNNATTSTVSNTPDPTLYQTERWGSFSYQFTVPNGNYNVVLKFAEIYWTSVGQRIFSVSINGTQVLTNFDIIAAAGAPLTAIDKTFPVTVTNGTIAIQFVPGSADWPKVSAIEIAQTSVVSNATPSTQTLQGQLSLSQTSFAFGNVNIGATASQTFTLSNTGTAVITFSSVSVSGAGFNASGISNGVVLNPAQSTTFTATFTPAAAGVSTGSVAFRSNAINASIAITLSGTGVQLPTGSVALSWASSTSQVSGYNVYRGVVSGGPYTKLNATVDPSTSYVDSGLAAGTYYYVVTSVASGVESAYSNQTDAVIP